MVNFKLFKYTLYLSIVGIFLAVFLLFEQITHSPFAPCNINSTINCGAIISGPVAKTFGISTPLIGLIGYIGILIASFLKMKRSLLFLSTFGLLFCLWIFYQDTLLFYTICPVCIACQIVMLSEFILAIVINRNK